MGRSVSCPNNAYHKIYFDYRLEDEYDHEALIENIQEHFKSKYPSLADCNEWLDREDVAILENKHCYIGISSYFDLFCLWVVVKDNDHHKMSEVWVDKNIYETLEEWSTLKRVGTFSNGEAVYLEKTQNRLI